MPQTFLYEKKYQTVLETPWHFFTQNCFWHISITNLTDIDECTSNPCQNGGTCSNLVNRFSCSCPEHVHGTVCEFGNHKNKDLGLSWCLILFHNFSNRYCFYLITSYSIWSPYIYIYLLFSYWLTVIDLSDSHA